MGAWKRTKYTETHISYYDPFNATQCYNSKYLPLNNIETGICVHLLHFPISHWSILKPIKMVYDVSAVANNTISPQIESQHLWHYADCVFVK